MTIQNLFDRMMVLDNELDLVSGGADVTRGLVIINLAQDWFEAVAASYRDFLTTHSTFTTTADQETTTWPTGLLRLDGDPWMIDSASSLPAWKLEKVDPIGGHRDEPLWPFSSAINASLSQGIPQEYWMTGPGGLFYWAPIPDAEYTLRAYGLWAKSDYTAAANTFAYPDTVALVIVPFAVKMFRTGLDRELPAIQASMEEAFRFAVKSLGGFDRIGGTSKTYSELHTE